MEFSRDKILDINKSEDNFSDISFLAPYSLDDNVQRKTAQIDQLLGAIKKNVWGCDLILCLFIAALNSYRSDRCLRPFPQFYISEEGKNFTELRKICDNISPLNTILTEPNKCSKDVKRLLMWLFLEKRHPVLKRIRIDSVLFPSKFSSTFKPHYVFEVCYSDKFELSWQKRQNGRGTILAYHGSPVDNFYSILKVGLQQHFSLEKEVLFGNGIYLSSELSLSAHYAPFGRTWTNSMLGNKHSIIAVCEVINDVQRVKCRDATDKRRSQNKDSFGEIPEKYYVVTDNDMVRVKYLMVYKQKPGFSFKSCMADHLFLFLLAFYFIAIIAIGFFSNSVYVKFLKRLINSFAYN